MRMQKSQLDTPIGFNLKYIAQCVLCSVRGPCIQNVPVSIILKGIKIRRLKKGWIHGHTWEEIMDLDFENYKNVNKCICRRGLSLFGCAENILNKVHIVHWGANGIQSLGRKGKIMRERTLLSSLLWAMPESKHSSSREVSKYGIPMIFLGYHGDKHAKGKCHCTASTASRSVSSSSTNFLVSTFVVILVLLSNIQYRQYRSTSTTTVRRKPSTVHKKRPLLCMEGSLITN